VDETLQALNLQAEQERGQGGAGARPVVVASKVSQKIGPSIGGNKHPTTLVSPFSIPSCELLVAIGGISLLKHSCSQILMIRAGHELLSLCKFASDSSNPVVRKALSKIEFGSSFWKK
jgi:hypothetical protein